MINAKIICDSINPQGDRLTTLEIVLPRYILAELNTHRMLSKNSASSRAIPFSKMVQNVMDNPFIPYAWQVDHKGMQGSEYLDELQSERSKYLWLEGRDNAVDTARDLNENEVTKQLANRLLEPFMYHKVLVSGTEWENFFNLRCPQYQIQKSDEPIFKSWKELTNHYEDKHHDFWTGLHLEKYTTLERLQKNKGQADIHMMFLAEAIYDTMNESVPKELKEGEWHIPYGDNMNIQTLNNYLINTDLGRTDTIETLKGKISIARCARLSYQTLGDNPVIDYEKDLQLYEVLSKSGHWSPFEHVAKVMTEIEYFQNIKGYMTCTSRNDIKRVHYGTNEDNPALGWCRNYKGFIQYRELLDN